MGATEGRRWWGRMSVDILAADKSQVKLNNYAGSVMVKQKADPSKIIRRGRG